MQMQAPVLKNEISSSGELYLYDMISDFFGISAADVADALKGFSGTRLTVYINSPGGDVFEARAIASNLKRLSASGVSVTAVIDGLCASAATMVAVACDEVQMNDGCMFMIHEVSGMAYGTKTELRKYADLCEQVEQECVQDYVKKTGMDTQDLLAMMEAETWLNAKDALSYGFVDKVIGAGNDDEEDDDEDDGDRKDPPAEPDKKEEKLKDSVGKKRNANRLKLLIAEQR